MTVALSCEDDLPQGQWEFLHSMRRDLVAQARGRGLTLVEAEDVASEAVVRGGFKSDLDLVRARGWLRVVVQRLAVDAYRERMPPAVASRLVNQHVQDEDPHRVVDDRLEAQWVAELVKDLPERQQVVLRRRANGDSLEEIAHALGCSYKTAESLLSRARASMRSAMSVVTGVLIGIGLGWRRVVRISPSVGVASVLTVGALAALHPLGPHEGRGGVAVSSVLQPREAVELAGIPASSRHRAGGGVLTFPHRTANPRGNQTIGAVSAGKIGPVSHGSVAVTRSHRDESLLATAVRCLKEGPHVSTDQLGCS